MLPLAALAVVAVVALAVTTLGGGNDAGDERAAGASDADGIVDEGPVTRDVQIEGAGSVAISGTLALPEGVGPGAGLAGLVFIPGYGPTNRDGLAPEGGITDPYSRDLSDALVEEGMVTFRYDKRGTGRSALPPDEPLRFDDMVADAAAAVAFLAERAEVDPERIAVVGHEEGGLVAMALAASDPRVRGVALVSTPGRPLLEVLTDDFLGSGHEDDVAALRSVVEPLLAEGAYPAAIPPAVAGYFPVDQEEYVLDIFSLDPAAIAADVAVPVLFVRGETATLVNEADAAALVDAIGPNIETFVAASAGHTLAEEESVVDSGSGEHGGEDHDAIGTAPESRRSSEAYAALTEFLTVTTAAA